MVKCTVLDVWVPKPASWVRPAIRGPRVPQGKEIQHCAKPDCSPRCWFAVLQSPAAAHFPVQWETPAVQHGALSRHDIHTVLKHLLAQLKVYTTSWCLCHALTHPLSHKKFTQRVTCVTIPAATAKEGRAPMGKGCECFMQATGRHMLGSHSYSNTLSVHWALPLPQQEPVHVRSQRLNAGCWSPKLDWQGRRVPTGHH